MASRCYKAH